ARETGQRQLAQNALKLYHLYHQRYPNGSGRDSLPYKTADCCLLCDQQDEFRAGMEYVAQMDRQGPWGPLPSIRLAGPAHFREHMDELFHLAAPDDEEDLAFLDLADQALPILKGEDRVKCLYYKARCLPESRRAEALKLYRTIVRKYPRAEMA